MRISQDDVDDDDYVDDYDYGDGDGAVTTNMFWK